MTKQEEIGEEIGKILDKHNTGEGSSSVWCGCDEGDYRNSYPQARSEAIEEILSYLHSQGVVIKVERELPIPIDNQYLGRIYVIGADQMEKLVAVEPLVEEPK